MEGGMEGGKERGMGGKEARGEKEESEKEG